MTVLSTLPASAGLGSSAAFSVSLAAVFLSLVGTISLKKSVNHLMKETTEMEGECVSVNVPKSVTERLRLLGACASECESVSVGSPEDRELINGWGLKAEKLIHGTPSGIDNSISTFGIYPERFFA